PSCAEEGFGSAFSRFLKDGYRILNDNRPFISLASPATINVNPRSSGEQQPL
ncbi:uncharacterized protein METZ01_LOCUS337357, partial [marine metagenome]